MKTHFLRIRSIVPVMVGAWTALAGLISPNPALAQDVRLQDLLQSEFERPFEITGWGLVTGLQGTGDTGGNYAAALNYIERLKRAGVVEEADLPQAILKEESIALVQVTVTVPQLFGSGIGYECFVDAGAGGAESLAGGTLLITPLRRSDAMLDRSIEEIDLEPVIGFAQGRLAVSEASPTRGRIARGARLVTTGAPIWETLRSSRSVVFDVKNPAYESFMILNRLVDSINEELLEDGFADLARITAARQITVDVPESELDAFRFAGRVLSMNVDFRNVEPPARIRWNPTTGVLTVSGNTTFGDATVSIDGFSIQRIEPRRPPTLQNPDIVSESFTPITSREQAPLSLQSLKAQLDMLRVPARSQAQVLQQLCESGQCNAVFTTVGLEG